MALDLVEAETVLLEARPRQRLAWAGHLDAELVRRKRARQLDHVTRDAAVHGLGGQQEPSRTLHVRRLLFTAPEPVSRRPVRVPRKEPWLSTISCECSGSASCSSSWSRWP